MASGNRRVEFDRNVQTLGQSWTSSSVASTSAGSTASMSTEHYQQRNSSPLSGNSSGSSSSSSLPGDRLQSPYSPGNYQSYHQNQTHQTYQPSRIEYYEEDDDDLDDSYSLYINKNGGGGGYSEYAAHSKLANGALIHHHTDSYHHDPHEHLQPIPTTLYRNGSVSIVNCEYKLKEKYPHLIYLLFFVVIYILLILLGASLFVLFEAKTELRLRDQILIQQQMFLDANTCVDAKDLKQFVKSIMTANDKGVNLAKLNELIDLQEAQQRNESQRAENVTTILPEFAQTALNTVEKTFHKTLPESSKNGNNKYYSREEEKTQGLEELAGGKSGNKYSSSASSDASIQINKHVKPIKVPVEMANWEFFSSLNYVTTVVTTIGYGHVTPVTEEGKILTLVFGAIAIPATLLFFSVIISAIRDGPVKIVEIWLIKFFSHFTQITLLKIRFIHLILITFILFLMLILLPSFIFLQLEPEWTFLDSFYYCFITITTVGLGDYVPAQSVALVDSRPFYLLGTVLYMYFGLCMIMLWIALVLRIPYFNFKTFLVIEEPEISEEKIPDERTALLAENSTHTYASIY